MTNVENSDTMKTANTVASKNIKAENAMSDIQYVGKINREIFKVISDDIQTDEVIITDVQIEHIKERHPNDYEDFYNSLRETDEKPEYVFQSDEPNSALVMNRVDCNRKSLVIVLRLKISTDPDNYKNSIITLMGISEKKRKKYIRNKKILYKRE